MSNSFTSDPTLVDPGRLTASQTIRTTEIARLSDLANYCFATGGAYNVISQLYDDNSFCTNSNTFISMAEWRIPRISNLHNTLVINLQAFCPTAANATAEIDLDFGSVKYTTQISLTDEGRYNASFSSGTITATGVHADETAIVKLSLKAPTGQEVVLLGIQANWQALTSPLTTGELGQHNNTFTPQGQTRQGTDKPLSSRWGVEMLNNLNTLRRRPRVLFNWSGVEGISSGSGISSAGAAPRAIATGDLNSMFSESAIFPGMRDDSTLDLTAYVHVIQNGGSYTPISIDLLGERITMNSTGWTTHTLNFRLDELPRSDDFGLSVYRVGPDESAHNLTQLFIFGVDMDGGSGTYLPYVAGLTIIGV